MASDLENLRLSAERPSPLDSARYGPTQVSGNAFLHQGDVYQLQQPGKQIQ